MDAYLAVISRDSHTTAIHLADVFCGPGSYSEGKIGSPVVITRKLAALHKDNPSAPDTFFLANDKSVKNSVSVEKLVRPLAEKHQKLHIDVTQGVHDKKVMKLLSIGGPWIGGRR